MSEKISFKEWVQLNDQELHRLINKDWNDANLRELRQYHKKKKVGRFAYARYCKEWKKNNQIQVEEQTPEPVKKTLKGNDLQDWRTPTSVTRRSSKIKKRTEVVSRVKPRNPRDTGISSTARLKKLYDQVTILNFEVQFFFWFPFFFFFL